MAINTFEITIPVLNEEVSLKSSVSALYDFCLRNFPDSEQWSIVIADNGSTDKTQQIGTGLVKEFGNIRYIRLEEKGVGRALRAAWQNASADIIGSMDLDLSTALRHLPEALAAVTESGYDLIYATRLHKDAKVTGRSLRREFSSRAFNWIMRHYLHVSISDAMCGFTFFKRSLLNELLQNGAMSDGWFFQAEILVVSEWLGLHVAELPVNWIDDRESKVRILPLALEYIRAMKELKRYRP
jgi:glycosyltransferase involved in cell wall biosynthesis